MPRKVTVKTVACAVMMGLINKQDFLGTGAVHEVWHLVDLKNQKCLTKNKHQ